MMWCMTCNAPEIEPKYEGQKVCNCLWLAEEEE